jgi:hypothetical protein
MSDQLCNRDLEPFTVLPRTGIELYGMTHLLAYGGSIVRCGSTISGSRGTLRPDAFRRLDLIQRGYFGHDRMEGVSQ